MTSNSNSCRASLKHILKPKADLSNLCDVQRFGKWQRICLLLLRKRLFFFFLTADRRLDFVHCLACMSQSKVGKVCKCGESGKSSFCICILDIGLAQLCRGLFAIHCLHLIILMNHIHA